MRGKPHRLKVNEGLSFIGSYVLGMGFILTPEEAQRLIDKDPRNAEVLQPYLNGKDLNTHPEQKASRWVINFRDWPLEKAEEYPDLIKIVRERVKPERDKLGLKHDASARGYARLWWQFGRRGEQLYRAIAGLERVLACAQTSARWAPVFLPKGIVYSHTVVAGCARLS